MNKLKLWKEGVAWDEAASNWDKGARAASQQNPIRELKVLPDMVGITPDTAKHLRWKSLKWMVSQEGRKEIIRSFLKHPFLYGWRYLKSLFHRRPFTKDGDFFLYGISSLDEFRQLIKDPDALFVVGFSYCHKPFECPSGRFTSLCQADPDNPVCRQCFIGKAVNALPQGMAIPLFIPTVHYIAIEILKLKEQHPRKAVHFLITACEMTLTMFADWGNMAGIKGVGVRLDGRICNTMKAFELSEKGIKPGLTVVLEDTQKVFLSLIRERYTAVPQR